MLWYLQPVTLELGGKSPIIVFDDVDVEKGMVDVVVIMFFWAWMMMCSVVPEALELEISMTFLRPFAKTISGQQVHLWSNLRLPD
jgi:betaine-aldehyde dehydrogenase